MNKKNSPTIASITRRTILCLAAAIAIFALTSVSNIYVQMSSAILLIIAFVLLSFYALKRVNDDLL